MHETETIETMRRNWWATRVFHQTSKREQNVVLSTGTEDALNV